MVAVLAEPTRGGPVPDFAVGTGRAALPLSACGIAVHGLGLAPTGAQRLSAKPGAAAIPATVGE